MKKVRLVPFTSLSFAAKIRQAPARHFRLVLLTTIFKTSWNQSKIRHCGLTNKELKINNHLKVDVCQCQCQYV